MWFSLSGKKLENIFWSRLSFEACAVVAWGKDIVHVYTYCVCMCVACTIHGFMVCTCTYCMCLVLQLHTCICRQVTVYSLLGCVVVCGLVTYIL